MEQRRVVPRRLLFGVAAVMLFLRESDAEDAHLEFIREAWARVDDQSGDDQSPDSVLAFVQRILAKQVEWSREPIDLRVIAPEIARILTKIRERGLRVTMEFYVS
jgi:hypothetical protein